MKKFVLILLLVALAGNLNILLSWDSTAAKYYPLNVGNIWVYESYYTMFGNTYFGGYRKHFVAGDTIFNGHRYFRVNPLTNGCNYRKYERVDSSSMNVYRWDSASGRDILTDSLLARKNNSFVGYRNCSNINNIPAVCTDTGFRSVFGSQVKSKWFNNDGLLFMQYILSENLGVSYYITIEGNSSWSVLKGCVINGVVYGDTSMLVGVNQVSTEIPKRFSLYQNYPNPFNPTTKIKFQIPKSGLVKMIVYDILGREVQSLVNQQLSPGIYEADFDASNLPSSIYYYKITAGDFIETKKMVFIK